ncbi:DUF2177 family protein [Aquabacterium sp.]|uniref:DUF2177 family protein n=1 Tax=Aquabacterium sp. TaxID=1872578 RepID=UPI0037831A01
MSPALTPWAAYGAMLLTIGLLDAVWLGWLARGLYQREIGALLSGQVQALPALLFYLGYPAGLWWLALTPRPDSWTQAAWRCALLGLIAYGTYDFTNLATLKGWSWRIALVDTGWGIAVSLAAGSAAWWVTNKASA